MSRRCPNCDQRLLEDEALCWYCGAQLEPVATGPAASKAQDWEQDELDRSLAIYGALTILVLLAALILTVYLGG